MLERLPDLIRLVPQLDSVVQALPHTSPAAAEGGATRGAAVERRGQELLGVGLGVAFLVLGHSGTHHVAGHSARHEDHEVARLPSQPRDALATERQAGHREVDELIALELPPVDGHPGSIRGALDEGESDY